MVIFLAMPDFTAQEGPFLAPIEKSIDMFPKTPDAAALSKFVDIPPGDFTGVANFSIPLYTIKTGGLDIPLNLSYTTAGIKVGEISSRVGLGWALNTGPFLSQQVIGNRDRTLEKPILDFTEVQGPCDYETWQTYSFTSPSPCGIALSAIGLYPFEKEINPDLQPDIFSYSLLNDNGHFILDYNGEKGIPRPFNLNKIIPKASYGKLNAIEITDQQGVIYKFSDGIGLRQIRNRSSCDLDNEEDDIPNFKLDSIITVNNKKVFYSYTKQISASYITSITEDQIIDKQIVGIVRPEYYPPERCINKTEVSLDRILRSIDFEDGKVMFYYNNDIEGYTEPVRQDLIGDVYLTKVVVKDNNNKVVRDISLLYDYFQSTDSAPEIYQSALSNSPEIYYRLKLIEVRDNLSNNAYKLIYYGDDEGKRLPNRMSFSQDYWGVYNGQNNNSPIASVKTNSINNPEIRVYMGANKLPDISYGVIANLKKIIYPTGGYTQITYEADDFFKEIYNPPLYNYTEHESNQTDLNSSFVEFEIPHDGKPIYNQSIILEDSMCPENSQQPSTSSTPRWELYKKNISGTYSKVGEGDVCSKTVGRDDSAGTYRLKVFERTIDGAPSSPTGTRTIVAKFYWIKEILVNPSSVDKIGTIRVKQIESNSADNGKIIRKYEYKNPITNLSSGKNQGQELLLPLSTKEKDVGPHPPARTGASRSMRYFSRINNPGWQLSSIKGKSVCYEYVQEIYESFITPTDNYKKQSKFNLGYSDPLYQYNTHSLVNITYPQKILDAGLLLEEQLFNKNGDTVRYIKNEYDLDSYFNQFASMNFVPSPYNTLNQNIGRGMEVKTKKIDTDNLGGKYFFFNTNYFNIKNIWIKNTITTTKYYVNNIATVSTKQNTYYSTKDGQNKHTFPELQSSTVLGSGITTSKHYRYAHDLNTYLKTKNIISIPLETVAKRNNLIISKTSTNYPGSEADAKLRIINNTDNKDYPLPFNLSSEGLQPGDGMRKEIEYDFYDDKGNLIQYTLKPDVNGNGIPVTIIWGYNQTQPIAKIEGAKYDDIKANSLITAIISAADADASDPEQEPALITAFDNLRKGTGFEKYQITTYTYDPLIGVTSITPPSGIREVYIYDSANRLKEIKDLNGNILKEFKYNYKQ